MPIDPNNLSAWYAAHAPALTLYARQFATPADAQDMVHEAFTHLLAQPRAPENVKAWLYTTVRNAALSHARSAKRRDRRQSEFSQLRPEWFLPRPDDLIDAATAQAALATLPPDQRETVVLRIYAQHSFQEIADLTHAPLSTVYDRYKKALAALKQKMESSCTKTNTP